MASEDFCRCDFQYKANDERGKRLQRGVFAFGVLSLLLTTAIPISLGALGATLAVVVGE